MLKLKYKENLKKIITLALTVMMFCTTTSVAFGQDVLSNDEQNSFVMISSEAVWENELTFKEIKVFRNSEGIEIIDTQVTTYGQDPRLKAENGSADKENTLKVKDGGGVLAADMVVGAHFEWDSIDCIVSGEYYEDGIQSGYDMKTWKPESSNSGFLNKAYAKVNYGVYNQIGRLLKSGKLEVTCSKTGG